MNEIILMGQKLIHLNEQQGARRPIVYDFNYISLIEAGELLHVHPKQVKIWCDQQLITNTRIGATTYLNPDILAREVAEGKLDSRRKKECRCNCK